MTNDDPKKPPEAPQPGKAWDAEQEIQEWKKEYDTLKDQLTNLDPESDVLGELESLRRSETPPDIKERRAEPRYFFPAEKNPSIYAHMGPKGFRILNISVGGVAFYSDVEFKPGTQILLSALGMVALDVEIVACELEETNPDFMEFRYLVRAKFSDRVNGYLVYVLSREMYLKQVQAT